MDYLPLFNKAIDILKSKAQLPESGFLAGGSLGNTIWNLVTGKPGPINDIDIYRIREVVPYGFDDIKRKQNFRKPEQTVWEDYTGLCVSWKTNDYYVIEEVGNSGLINYIDYKSNTLDPQIILDSFDINCCQIGYDLGSKKFHWTPEFIDFLETREIKLSNLTSPSHSAIRLIKKKKELGADLNTLELEIIAFSLGKSGQSMRFVDTTKLRFKSRYAEMFERSRSELDEWFEMKRDEGTEEYLRTHKNDNSEIYYLVPKKNPLGTKIPNEIHFALSSDFLFWVRRVMGNLATEKMWHRISLIWDTRIDYFDIKPEEQDIELLERVINISPNSVNNLKGKPISKQLGIIRTLLEKFKDDPIVAVSILEKTNFNENVNLDDEWNLFLLEMSVRKDILEDPMDKALKITNQVEEKKIVYTYGEKESENFF